VKVSVYVDGFNLYYRAVKDPRAPDGSTYKWLDLHKLATNLLPPPKYDVQQLRYFTAHVRGMPHDPQAPLRQQMYLRALRTIPIVTIHLGHFMATKKMAALVTPLADGTKFVKVHKTEEKGSDVNLAAYLLLDGFRNQYDVAAVITNDSDLVEPIRIVRDELKKQVIVLEPRGDAGNSKELRGAASAYKPIRLGAIAASLFAPEMTDGVGTFRKPTGW
jgi:uncharacterized LabA/DUF88 family protein